MTAVRLLVDCRNPGICYKKRSHEAGITGTSGAIRCLTEMARLACFGRRIRLSALALIAGTVLFGPTWAAFALSKPSIALAMKPPQAVIAVHPFLDLGALSCFGDPPVHQGPIEWTGRHLDGSMAVRMDEAAFHCLRPGTDDHFVLTVLVDARGKISEVEVDHDPESDRSACAASAVRRSAWATRPRPGRTTIGYFMASYRR